MSSDGPSATITSAASLSSASASASGAESASSKSSSKSSSRAPQVHTVKAGSGGFKFEPQQVSNVSVGDTITFEFYPPDHSVARAEFGSACVPYEYTGKNKTGFWSDTQYVDDVNELKYWNLTINSTEPIFFYCAAPKSCTEQHMVGVINPNDTQTLEEQVRSAEEASFQVKPGDPIPAEGSSTLTAATAAATATSGANTNNQDNNHHGLSGGAIAGIVVGAVAFLVICAALFFYVGRTKSLKEVIHRRDATVAKSTPDANPYNHPSHPSSPGFPPAPFSPGPFSPNHTQAEYGGQLPAYGQHNATDAHPGGWATPQPSPQPQMVQVTPGQDQKDFHHGPHEMASPGPEQQAFRAELEAPIKSPR